MSDALGGATQAGSCEGKEPFNEPSRAAKIAKKMSKRRNLPFEIYRCQFCSQWHIGIRTSSGYKSKRRKMGYSRKH